MPRNIEKDFFTRCTVMKDVWYGHVDATRLCVWDTDQPLVVQNIGKDDSVDRLEHLGMEKR